MTQNSLKNLFLASIQFFFAKDCALADLLCLPVKIGLKNLFLTYIFFVNLKYMILKNNYMEGPGSATKNNVAHPNHPEEEETSPNRNHIITGKQQQTN